MKVKQQNTNTVMIVAGEASGDAHGANLVRGVKQQNPAIHFIGMGGSHLQQAGMELLIDSSQMGVVGLFEILSCWQPIYNALKKLRYQLRNHPPALLILIDYPGMNLHLARIAKKYGIKVLYYISPQVWAHRQKRVKRIKKYVDMMAVIFPFEATFFQRFNVPVKFVGHPCVNQVKPQIDPAAARDLLNFDKEDKLIGLLPGSRKSEIKKLLPVIIQTAELLVQKHANLKFVLVLAPTLTQSDIAPYLANTQLNIKITDRMYDTVNTCNAVIAASGTASLEVALLGIPMAILYRVANLTYLIAKKIIKIPYIGLCNIIADKQVVKEFIQHDAEPKLICDEIDRILTNTRYRENMQQELKQVKQMLDSQVGDQTISDVVLEMLNAKSA